MPDKLGAKMHYYIQRNANTPAKTGERTHNRWYIGTCSNAEINMPTNNKKKYTLRRFINVQHIKLPARPDLKLP